MMYVAPAFVVTDSVILFSFIEQYSFATLISNGIGEIDISHLPLLVDRTRGPQGALLGHFAAANSQSLRAVGGRVTAIFHGPHAYISPSWYEVEQAVPTWNYLAAHVQGELTVLEGPDERMRIVGRSVEWFEVGMERPWTIDRAERSDDAFVENLLSGIVAFEVRIETIQAKWKLGQNLDEQRWGRAAGPLRQQGGEDAVEIARLMDSDPDRKR